MPPRRRPVQHRAEDGGDDHSDTSHPRRPARKFPCPYSCGSSSCFVCPILVVSITVIVHVVHVLVGTMILIIFALSVVVLAILVIAYGSKFPRNYFAMLIIDCFFVFFAEEFYLNMKVLFRHLLTTEHSSINFLL